MVTLYYMRRYVQFIKDLLETESGAFKLTESVNTWLSDTAAALASLRAELGESNDLDALRYQSLQSLGAAACKFRQDVYARLDLSETIDRDIESVRGLLNDALAVIDHSIAANKRDDGLYHAYNIAHFNGGTVPVNPLYPMLEGQVAALSAGTIDAKEATEVLNALFASSIYREGQNSFMLYPDRALPNFLERNQLAVDAVLAIPLLADMINSEDGRIVIKDAEGVLRFNPDFTNASGLTEALDVINGEYGDAVARDRDAIFDLYESVFHHSEFTGRSGTMFGFEGLGSVYWHMVSKLLLAVGENYVAADEGDTDAESLQQLGELYYRVRGGLSFNKTPEEYGAFPTDPYSHTPKHAGARQPGMTGQVKEEIVSRFMELGIRVRDGRVSIEPSLLRPQEFAERARSFCYLNVDNNWSEVELPKSSIAFTWCQVPFVYVVDDAASEILTIEFEDGSSQESDKLEIPHEISKSIFARDGNVRRISVTLNSKRLFGS